MDEKKEKIEKETEEEKQKEEWVKKNKIGGFKELKPLFGNLLLLLEEEKKKTLKKIEDTKKILEKVKQNEHGRSRRN